MPALAKHGGWTGMGAEIDQRIRVMLARGNTPERVAEMVGVATGYVEALARELAEAEDRPPAAARLPLRPPEPGAASSRVHCIVAGEEIGARECIQRQCDQKCFCPKASFAINAIAPTVLPGTRLEDQLAQCRAVARTVLLKPDGQRHLGPALVALRGGKVAPQPLVSPVPLPAPPKRDEEKKRPERSYALERATSAEPVSAPEPIQQPAVVPAKEKPMPRGSKTDPCDKCGGRVGNRMPGQTCGACVKKAAKTEANGNGHAEPKAPKPRAARKPRPVEPKANPSAPAIPDDIVGMLQRQRDHYQAQVARMDRAIAALSE